MELEVWTTTRKQNLPAAFRTVVGSVKTSNASINIGIQSPEDSLLWCKTRKGSRGCCSGSLAIEWKMIQILSVLRFLLKRVLRSLKFGFLAFQSCPDQFDKHSPQLLAEDVVRKAFLIPISRSMSSRWKPQTLLVRERSLGSRSHLYLFSPQKVRTTVSLLILI